MGLLSRAGKKTNGLLAKSLSARQAHVFASFSAFCQKHHFTSCALLKIIDGSFVISDCMGIDAPTVVSSVSTPDFWNGAIGTEYALKRFAASDNTLAPFYQLFSEAMRETVCALHIVRLSPEAIFMHVAANEDTSFAASAQEVRESLLAFIAAGRTTKMQLPDFASPLSSCSAQLLLLSVKNVLNSFSVENAALTETICAAVYNELFAVLQQSLKQPNCTVQTSHDEIKLIIFAQEHFDEQLLQAHIARTCSKLLGAAAESFIIIKAGVAHTVQEITQFVDEG